MTSYLRKEQMTNKNKNKKSFKYF